MAVRHHTLDIYGTELFLVTNKRDWSNLRRKHSFMDDKAPEAAGYVTFATWHPNGPGIVESHCVIWIDVAGHKDDALELVNTIAHEAAHAAGRILEWIEHEVKGTDEPSAYLTGWLTRWIVEGVKAA